MIFMKGEQIMRSKTLLNIAIAVFAAVWISSVSSAQQYRTPNGLTGTYRLDVARSDNPDVLADRATRNLPSADQSRLHNAVLRRLEAPDSLALDVQNRLVTMASSRAPQVTFDADGRAQTEQTRNGRYQQTTATLAGQRLTISTTGDRTVDYQLTFDLIDAGRTLRVTRSVTDENLPRPVVARSFYTRTSDYARFDDFRGNSGSAVIPDGVGISAVLNDNLNTNITRDGDRFNLTVQSPSQYNGAVIEGHVVQINRAGKVAGRSEMAFDFDRIRLRDGRVANFNGYIESVRTPNGESLNVDRENRVQEDSQTNRTVTNTGVGAAIGALIGALADGGKGAAIGAAVGGGAGVAGSVFVQGRDDLDLVGGTEFRLRAIAS